MDILPKEYDDWVASYFTPLGLDRPGDVVMARSWLPIFRHAGYTMVELGQARDMIVRHPPEFRTQHLRRIHEAVASTRVKAIAQEREFEETIETYEECKLCQGTGWVEVPHPRYVRDGQWLQYDGAEHKFNPTATVCCRCHRGERQYGLPRRVQSLNLEKYEAINPDWERHMATWHEAQLAERRAHAVALETDKSLGKLLAEVGKDLPPEPPKSKPRDPDAVLREERLMEIVPARYRDEHVAKLYPQALRPGPQGHNQIGLGVEAQIEKMMTTSYDPEFRSARDARLVRDRQAAELVRRERQRRHLASGLAKKKTPGVKVFDPGEGLFDDLDRSGAVPPLSEEPPY